MQAWVKDWNKLSPLWVAIMFVYDTVPSIITVFALLKLPTLSGTSPSRWSRLVALHRVDKTFSILVLLQFINLLSYVIVALIRYFFTLVLLTDRNWQALDGFFAFHYCIHSVLCCLLMEHVSVIAGLRVIVSEQINTGKNSGSGFFPRIFMTNVGSPNQSSDTAVEQVEI
jgi:hypothetical protein